MTNKKDGGIMGSAIALQVLFWYVAVLWIASVCRMTFVDHKRKKRAIQKNSVYDLKFFI